MFISEKMKNNYLTKITETIIKENYYVLFNKIFNSIKENIICTNSIYLNNIFLKIKNSFNFVIEKNFLILFNNNLLNMCLICNENLKNNNITVIKCEKCKKELGHFNCIYKWIKKNLQNNKCFHCLQ